MVNLHITKYYLKRLFGGNTKKWDTLEHNGVLFPPKYEIHRTPIIYNGEQLILEPKAEEIATLYAKYIDTEYNNSKIFKKNFWNDWKKVLGKTHKIQNLDLCDFSLINKYILQKKEERDALSKEEKDKKKKEREEEEKKYKVAIVNGKEQPVGNFRVEPIGIFIGRGCHPQLGSIKKKILPEDIIINIGKESKIPEAPNGHKWGKIIHDKTVEWLAAWKDNISGKMKYVWLGAHSDFKAKSDIEKFDKARKLKKNIKKIREENNKNLLSDNLEIKQIATALYFIDNFALRVGNEKSEDEADTVGITSIRVEHIELLEDNTIKLDFLGKDSVRYVNKIKADDIIYNNIKQFMENKNKDDNLFNLIDSNDLNNYLKKFMKGLTAKVFRTFNASNLFYKELKKITNKYDSYTEADKVNILLDEFNKANSKVAQLCNHQKNISKSFEEQLNKMKTQEKEIKSKIKKAKSEDKKKNLKMKLNKLKIKKELKVELKNISLGTSKINYIDPRITVAFMKKHNLPIDKIFSKTLQEKFRWAFDVDENFKF